MPSSERLAGGLMKCDFLYRKNHKGSIKKASLPKSKKAKTLLL